MTAPDRNDADVPLVGGPADGHVVVVHGKIPRRIVVPVVSPGCVPNFGDTLPPIVPTFGQVDYTVTMERYPPGPEGPRFFAYCREGA